MDQQNNRFIYKDADIIRPRGLIFFISSGLILLVLKINFFSLGNLDAGIEKVAWFFLAISLIMILLSSNLTVIADKSSRILQLHYSYLFFRRTKDIPFDDIFDIQSHSNSGNIESPSNVSNPADRSGCRLVVVLKDGTKLPFRRYFTPYTNKKEAATNLRLAVTGSRQSDVLKVKSTDFTLPIKMMFSWWAKIIFVFSVIFSLFLAVLSFLSEHDVLVSLCFALFALLGVYTLILSQLTVEIDQSTITLSLPPHGIYMMNWRDVQLVEINGTTFTFIGDNKLLVISLVLMGHGNREFLAFFNHFVQEYRIKVEPTTKMRFRQKNTKVS